MVENCDKLDTTSQQIAIAPSAINEESLAPLSKYPSPSIDGRLIVSSEQELNKGIAKSINGKILSYIILRPNHT